jgi:hypothetical protein
VKVFVSYNRDSAEVTKELAEDIKALGHTAWYDQELGGGQAWWAQILERIRSSDAFVFVLDPASLDSTACKREWGYASELGKPILPVLVSDDVSSNLLPPALSRIQFVDYRTQDRDAAIRLARALATLPPAAPLPDPLPEPPETPVSYLGTLTAQVGSTSTLTFEEQCGLVVDLRRALRDPGTAHDARTLLETLRRRRELFASVAEEIDELLGTAVSSRPNPPVTQPPEVPGVRIPDREGGAVSTSDQTAQTAGTVAAPASRRSMPKWAIIAVPVIAVLVIGLGAAWALGLFGMSEAEEDAALAATNFFTMLFEGESESAAIFTLSMTEEDLAAMNWDDPTGSVQGLKALEQRNGDVEVTGTVVWDDGTSYKVRLTMRPDVESPTDWTQWSILEWYADE